MKYTNLADAYGSVEYYEDLHQIHENTVHMDMNGELPEQELIFRYIRSNAKVLELGGNIGRASIVISKILDNPKHHVVLESDPAVAHELEKNKVANHCEFEIVIAALSEKPMIQNEMVAKTVDDTVTPVPGGWKYVPTITYSELLRRHPIRFDTLVIDCEGCIYDIFQSYPFILDNIHTIIIENDAQFIDAGMNEAIRSFIRSKGFRSVECRDLNDMRKCFFEVWKR